MKNTENAAMPVQQLFKVYIEPNSPYDSPVTVTVMAPNEFSARQRAMVMHQQGYTVTDVEVKATP